MKSLLRELYENVKENIFIEPVLGIWAGYVGGKGGKDKEETSGHGYGVLGDIARYVSLGVLGGGLIGYGKDWGLATGGVGGIALSPLLGYNFVGIPLTITYKRKYGIGVIIPVCQTEWYIALPVALGGFILGLIGGALTEKV